MIKNFINKLQNSDETTKKLWLFALSGISMLIVVSFWVFYMDKTVAGVNQPENNARTITQVQQAQQKDSDVPGFFAIFSAGVKTIFDVVKDKLAVKNNIVIENPKIDFVNKEVEPIQATKLP